MPQAPWVLDAAYTAENGQSSFTGASSPQRHRRGAGVLHLDLRGVPAGPSVGSSSQTGANITQWKPATSYKSTAVSDGHVPGSHQPYSALLLSVFAAGNTPPGMTATGSAGSRPVASTSSNAMTVLSPGCTRGPAQPQTESTISAQLGQRTRPLAGRPTAAGGFVAPRIAAGQPSGQIATSSVSAGGASAAAPVPRAVTYNPLLPRQRTPSAGRRRPSMEEAQSSSVSTAAPPRNSANLRQNASSGNAPTGGASRGSDSGVRRAVAMPSNVTGISGFGQSSTGSAVAAAAPVALCGCHPEELVTPMTAALEAATTAVLAVATEVRSPQMYGTGGGTGISTGSIGGLQNTATAHGFEPGSESISASNPTTGPGLARSRSRFDKPRDAATASAGAGIVRARPDPFDSRPPSAHVHRHETASATSPSNQPSGASMSINMQTALAVLGVGTSPLPTGPLGAGRDGSSRSQPSAPPPASSSSASSSGLPNRLYSPVPHNTTHSSASGTEDSVLEYFGVYEGNMLSAEDGEGDEEEADEEEEVAEQGDGEGTGVRVSAAELRLSRPVSSHGLRSTANVHAVRRAAAATVAVVTGQRARPGPPSPQRQQRQQQQQQQQQLPWSLQRPPSGRPPAPPHPTGATALRRRSSLDVSVAAAAMACLFGSGSVESREGSASEAGSRPGTASSAWSGYDVYLAPELKLPPGRGRSSENMPAMGECRKGGTDGGGSKPGGVGARTFLASASLASAAARRRAASNPRDVGTLDCRNKSAKASGAALSRCSSAASHRAADRTAAQTLALLATLTLNSPTSPSAVSVSSTYGARGQRRAGTPTARGRKTGGGSGTATPHRALHPAVLALTDLNAAPLDSKRLDQIPADEKGRPFPYIQPPAFPGTCPTITFVGSAVEKHTQGLQPLLSPTLYVKYGGVANTPVRTAFKEAGLRPTRKGKRWVVQWGGILDATALAKLHTFQRVNHFPGTWELGHKGHLYRNVYNARRRARGPAAEAFDIVPRFYIMPRDYEEFKADVERFPDRLYIQKPTNSSRGRGIRMVSRPETISRDAKDILVQHYIANPLLLNGFKFDMRVYAAATCLDPLRLYVFPDGLARLATELYSADKADLSKRCVHLTNYSVNKKSAKFAKPQPNNPQPYSQQQPQHEGVEGGSGDVEMPGSVSRAARALAGAPAGAGVSSALSPSVSSSYRTLSADPSRECEGCKWSLSGLKHYMESTGLGPGWNVVWRQVTDIIAAAVISAEPRMNTEFKMKVPHRNNCFEVWGFDIMLTESFRAWLIEANTCPSLAADSGLDMRVKCSMVSELIHLLGPVPYDVEVYEKEAEAKRQARLTGLPATTNSPAAAARAAASSGGGGTGGTVEDEAPPTPTQGAQQSLGPAGGSIGGAGGVGGPGTAAVLQPKSLHELDAIDFTALSQAELPDVVLEAEAEMARKGSWQRVFPCEEDPTRYLSLFEAPRLNNMLLCKYYAQTTGNGSDAFKRPGSVSRGGMRGALGGLSGGGGVPGISGGGARPASRDWRPGGGG